MAKKKSAKKPVGRPRLKGARHITFCLRLTAEELAAVEKAAKAAGGTLRPWARAKLLRGLKIKQS